MEQSGKVVFLHKVKKGPADKSYGIHVAELANLPEPILARARELLETFEEDKKQQPKTIEQLSFFDDADTEKDEILQTIKDVQVSAMTPLQALQMLNDLQQKLNDKE